MSGRSRIRVDTSKGALRRLQKDVKRLKRFEASHEFKFFNSAINDAVVANTGAVQNQMFTLAQGDTDTTRDGKKVIVTSLNARFIISLPITDVNAQTADLVRIIIVHDKQANGALPAVLDILFTADIQSFKNLDNTHRFRTLLDKTISIASMSGAYNGTTSKFGENFKAFQWFRKLNMPIIYNDTAGTIGDIVSNNIVMMYISESGNAGCQAQMQIRYMDG